MSYEVWTKDGRGEAVRLAGGLTAQQARDLTRNLEKAGLPARAEER